MSPYLYAGTLLLTLAIEVPLASLLAKSAPVPRPWLDALFLNLLTHPLATLALFHRIAGFWPVEAAVALVEALGYRTVTRLSWGRALLVATACNGATVAVALILWP